MKTRTVTKPFLPETLAALDLIGKPRGYCDQCGRPWEKSKPHTTWSAAKATGARVYNVQRVLRLRKRRGKP